MTILQLDFMFNLFSCNGRAPSTFTITFKKKGEMGSGEIEHSSKNSVSNRTEVLWDEDFLLQCLGNDKIFEI